MKTLIHLVIAFLFSSFLFSQCPSGNILLDSQSDIDNFLISYPNCENMPYGITIQNRFGNATITNLNGLSNLTSIGGYLVIGDTDQTTDLINLNGLNNVTTIGGWLDISGNSNLISLDGLESLTSVGSSFLLGSEWLTGNHNLTDISALSNLTSIGERLTINENYSLTNLDGLNSLTQINGDLEITLNNLLENLDGLNSLTTLGDGNRIEIRVNNNLIRLNTINFDDTSNLELEIFRNASLQNLTELNNITELKALSINDNDALTNLMGLDNLTTINDLIHIKLNDNLLNLNGLNNLSGTLNSLDIRSNNNLATLSALSNVTEINNGLYIKFNNSLTNLEGLNNLSHIGYNLNDNNISPTIEITSNDNLINIQEIENAIIHNDVWVTIFGNSMLSNCSIISMCNFLSLNANNSSFSNNLAGCNSREEILANCSNGLNTITGQIKFDNNSDGCDIGDVSINNLMIVSENAGNSYSTLSINDANYQIFVGEDQFITSIPNLPNYYVVNPISQTSIFTGFGNTDNVNFCIEPTGIVNDLNISIYPSQDDPRPGFDTTYQIVYKNVGTTIQSGNVTFQFDDIKMQLLGASETVSSQTSNTITFDFTDLNPFEFRTIDLEFNVFTPPTTNINDILISTATINPLNGDNTEEDNVFELLQTVIGSFDPNDIRVMEGSQILLEEADKYLHYIIRFQNTGTASAINVNVENVLDDKLDWTTMQLESLSHTGRVEITDGNLAKFIFNNINLPDSTNDEPNSHGFIAYKIKLKTDVVVGDIIFNSADIFFDFNPAIVTNTVSTEIVNTLSVNQFNQNVISIYPNPADNQIIMKSNYGLDSITIYDINGRLLKTIINESDTLEKQIDVTYLPEGLYFLEIQSKQSKQTLKFIKK
jgi:hypothetical protein